MIETKKLITPHLELNLCIFIVYAYDILNFAQLI